MCDFVGRIIDLEKLPDAQKRQFEAFFRQRQRDLQAEITALNRRIQRLNGVLRQVRRKSRTRGR